MPSNSITQIYLSPHPDDAVFSCGGTIHRQAASGGRVVVVTVCAGNPPGGPLSDFARGLHERWCPGSRTQAADIVATRRKEDLAALDSLGAQAVHLDVPDCIYRLNPASGWPMYTSEAALFGSLNEGELSLVRRTATKLTTLLHGFGRYHLYVPLGVGSHVDHQLARRAAEAAGGVYAYYEDYPYITREPANWASAGPAAPHGRALAPELNYLDEDDLRGRVVAMACYASQLNSFWTERDNLDQSVRQFTAQVGGEAPAERIWKVG